METAPNGTQFLAMDKCKDGYLYHIDARNARLGIYKQKEMAFTISREKFSSNFLFDEYHWNIGKVLPEMEHFGTVFPLEEIEKAPEFKDDKEQLDYLNQKREEIPPHEKNGKINL